MRIARSIADDVAAISRIDAVRTILQVVARTTGLRFVAIARVTDSRWTACAVYDLIDFGLKPGGELAIESTICDEIRQHHKAVVCSHVKLDPYLATHHTPKLYGFESYISIPILRLDGSFFGTLCALDPLPAKLDDPNILKTLELFAQLISAQIDIEERLEEKNVALLEAQETTLLRERFIAVLGHDLRNSLQAIGFGAELLKERLADARALKIVRSIELSSGRMTELIQNVLDFARGRLGGGVPITLENDKRLADELRHVVSEVQATHVNRVIEVDMNIQFPVVCDRHRIAQLLGNLLSNAVTHGAIDQPVGVIARGDTENFELSVTNIGAIIAAEKVARLFQPFSRSKSDTHQSGLGLGLYIAAEIAKAHGGTLELSSSNESGTRFTFRMPTNSAAPAVVIEPAEEMPLRSR
jgi:signal transduction histidine kinase